MSLYISRFKLNKRDRKLHDYSDFTCRILKHYNGSIAHCIITLLLTNIITLYEIGIWKACFLLLTLFLGTLLKKIVSLNGEKQNYNLYKCKYKNLNYLNFTLTKTHIYIRSSIKSQSVSTSHLILYYVFFYLIKYIPLAI